MKDTAHININMEHEDPDFRGTPERNMLMAVLERAILDFVGTNEREAEAAAEWIFDEELEAEFSFAWICRELDLDAKKVAQDIKSLPKRTNHHIAPWYMRDRQVEEELAA